ncbi:MAG TPA: recombinase family protein [Polyangiales bacterium]|nr:recombinase family protein [Polyangiales bacterium]
MARRPRTDATIAVGYLRTSTSNKGQTTDQQRDALERYASEHGLRVVSWHTDQLSGSTPVDKRPGFSAVLAGVREHRAGTLLVATRDRLARDIVQAALAERELERLGARIASATGANGDDPQARFTRAVMDAAAELERALIAERVRRAREARAKRGGRSGGVVPFGFDASFDRKALIPNAAERRAIARMRELDTLGSTQAEICKALTDEGHKPRATRWNVTTVARVLRREQLSAAV